MLDLVVKLVLKNSHMDVNKYKHDLMTQVTDVAKKYWKIFAVVFTVILVVFIFVIWAIWSFVSSAAQGINIGSEGVVQKIETVGINGLIEEPMQLIRDLWYGKDGK